jgi:primosomal protein N''
VAHNQMDLVLQCLDDESLQQLHNDVESKVLKNVSRGYERERLIAQYLALVVEMKIRELDALGVPASDVA